MTANPNVTLSRAHVPRHCQRARTVILGPLTQHELDAGSFLEYDGERRVSRSLVCPRVLWFVRFHAFVVVGSVRPPRAVPLRNHVSQTRTPVPPRHPSGVWDALVRGRQYIGLMAQGFQRRLGPDGRVLPLLTPSPQLLVGAGDCQGRGAGRG